MHHDEEAAVKYIAWDTDQWISYDDADTFKQKKEWADDVVFSGSLIWASDPHTKLSLATMTLDPATASRVIIYSTTLSKPPNLFSARAASSIRRSSKT